MPRRANIRAIFGLLMLVIAVMACNARLDSVTPTSVAQGPSVVFIAPENNSTIAEGSQITFAVNASNPGGTVSKIDFLVDDVPIGTQSATDATQSIFTARQTWTASSVKGYLIQAVVSDADGKHIGDAKLTLQVVNKPQDGVTVASISAATVAATQAANAPTQAPTPMQATNTMVPTTAPTAVAQQANATPAPQQTVIILQSGQALLSVKAPNLNIRAGDGTNFPIIGAMKTGDTAEVVGRNAASTWWFVQKDQSRGWVIASAEFSDVVGYTANIPLVKSPATPAPTSGGAAPAGAPTSTTGAIPDLVIDSVTLNPGTPTKNQTFNATVVIRNQGSVDSGGSLLVGVFQPGNEISPTSVGPVKAGQTITVNLPVTLKSSGANQTAVITVDNNKDVDEGPNGEANNTKTITYNVNE